MSLATRCTSCNTVFKVVQDQLKVSKGWVRCGRCDTVFNALEELFELNGDTIIGGMRQPSLRSQPAAPAGDADAGKSSGVDDSDTAPIPEPSDAGAPPQETDPPPAADTHDEFSRSLFGPHRKGPEQTPADLVKQRDRNEFADAQFDSDLLAHDDAPGLGVDPPPASTRKSAATYTPPLPSDETPAFVRHADAQARWKTPRARLLLSLASLLLLAGLGLQIAHHFRDRLAAEVPASRSLLDPWCARLHCRIEAHRSIKDFTVENSALTRMPSTTDAFRLSVTLRNRGAVSLRLPFIDLSVTDAGGQLIARRALSPADFEAREDSVKPNTEAALQLVLKSVNPRVNGYTVEIFYP
jgi:predicted Zn finger-like uncharacterized protein